VSQVIGYARVSPTTAEVMLAFERHLERSPQLADHTKTAYRRQAEAYLGWWDPHQHPDAFVDQVGAEAAVGAWRRHLLAEAKQAPASVNQALAAVSLLYEVGCRIRIKVKRARVPKPGEPDALTRTQERAVRRAADERGARDSAIIAVLFGCGARVEECARLDLQDVALTARTGTVRLFGKGDEVRTVPVTGKAHAKLGAWLLEHPGGTGLWVGQRGRLTISGITKVVLAAGGAAGIPGLRPHRLRHTYATRLRESGADPAQIQALMGHAWLETTARYFRAGAAEVAALVERALDY
jgi:integrase